MDHPSPGRRPLLAALLLPWLVPGLPGCAAAPAGAAASLATALTPAIQLNQVGFLPGAAKWAACTGVDDAPQAAYAVVDAASGQVVQRGRLLPAAWWAPARQRVRLADFSALTRPGRYQLQLTGLPGPAAVQSPPFDVAADAYAALNAASIRAFMHNRAGIALQPAQAGPWARAAGHADPQARIHPSAAGPRRQAGDVIVSPRGWYDAGDYNQYIVNSGITVYTLLAAWEHFPAWFQAQRLNLPESGNGLPDLLNEVLWNLDWMLSMQDPDDGGVYHKLTTPGFDGVVMPAQADTRRVVVMKSTAATLDFAAVMAAASRVFRGFAAQRPGYAQRCLAAARAAWAWARAHPDVVYRQPADIHTGGYDDSHLDDEFAWAAAELYVSTGDDTFLAAMQPGRTAIGVPGWADVAGLAWMTLAHHREHLTPAADRRLIEDRVSSLATRLADDWQASAWRLSVTEADFVWGSNAVVLNRAMLLLQGYRLGGGRRQLDAAQAALDHVLGRNPLGTSMVTGFGQRSPLHPHHRPSQADGVAAPVPGFLVGGPNPGRQDQAGCQAPYPSALPALAWLDDFCSYASNEVAINWNAPLVYVSAALQVLTGAAA